MSMLILSGPGGPFLDIAGGPAAMPRAPGRQVQARLVRWSLCLAGAAAVCAVVLAGLSGRPAAAPPTPAPAPKSAWLEVNHPLRFYGLESAAFGKEPRIYEARRHTTGGGRQDYLDFGEAMLGRGPSLHLSVYRIGAEQAPEGRFYVEMARQAARSGLSVVRSAQPGDLPTRFGVFETADLTLATPAGEVPCLGYMLNVSKPELRIAGYACGASDRPIDRRTLACALDRLDILSGGADREIGRFFAAAELARGTGCGGARGGAGRTAEWIDTDLNRPALRVSDGPRKFVRK